MTQERSQRKRRKKRDERRGYNPRAKREHPGVSISTYERDGEKKVVLRWREPRPGGRTGKRKGCYAMQVKDGRVTDKPVRSRTAAHAHAVLKSDELKAEAKKLEQAAETSEANPDASWAELIELHRAYLERKGRSTKTIRTYKQTWPLIDSWRGRPRQPKLLEQLNLESFAAHVGRHYAEMSPHSAKTALVHFKALLNFGRKRVKCVMLDSETVAEGLQPTKKASVRPVALDTTKLRKILDKALDYNGGSMFPLLAFLMVTGCRLGEAEAVRWKPSKPGAPDSWCDFAGGRLLIYGGKTSRQRAQPFGLRPGLRRMLEVMERRVDTDEEPYIFGGKLPLALRDKREVRTIGPDGKPVIGKSGKFPLYCIREKSGGDWKVKDLRSTCATYLCNSDIGNNLYSVAGWLGHDYAILSKHYAKQYDLPPEQANAETVEKVLGIHDLIESWCRETEGEGGKIIPIRA